MCSIFGLAFQRGHKVKNTEIVCDVLDKLFVECMVRGRCASGIAITSSKNIVVLKKNIPANKFVELKEYKKAISDYVKLSGNNLNNDNTISIMGHCRQKTKGTELVNINNHPIIRNQVIGVHNGIISNDDILFNNYKSEFDRNGEVDSEILFALIDHFSKGTDSIVDAIKMLYLAINGSYACSFVHKSQPHLIWLFRNQNPCVIYHYKKYGLVIWASMSSFIVEATKSAKLEKPEEIVFNTNTGITIDLYRNKIYRFDLAKGISHGV